MGRVQFGCRKIRGDVEKCRDSFFSRSNRIQIYYLRSEELLKGKPPGGTEAWRDKRLGRQSRPESDHKEAPMKALPITA
jgi:hypothetical protein